MPFNNRTPEALLGRSDSKNPATTCRGLTTAGKPCRRSIAANKANSTASRKLQPGVFAVTENQQGETLDAAFYCWQHKDQAAQIAALSPSTTRPQPRLVTVNERTSIDSIVERLGVSSLSKPAPVSTDARNHDSSRVTRQQDSYQTHAVQREAQDTRRPERRRQSLQQVPVRRSQPKPGFFSRLCCFGNSDGQDEYYEIVRHRRPPPPPMREARSHAPLSSNHDTLSVPAAAQRKHAKSTSQLPCEVESASRRRSIPQPRRALSEMPPRSTNQRVQPSPTQNLLSFIPRHLSPEATAILLTELSKPISPHDDEGYIYIFWLTDTDKTPDIDTASSLLAQPHARTKDIDSLARSYSRREQSDAQRRTILLKIGRANNVHRRMTEWTQQCGYALSLVRWYPYISSSPQSSPRRENPPTHLRPDSVRPPMAMRSSSDQIRKVPHVHRVERLIHLELADKRVKRNCDACGKEHREWFQIEATERGVKAVDDVVRRWTAWAEQHQK